MPARKSAALLRFWMSERLTRACVAVCSTASGREYPPAHRLESLARWRMSMMIFCMRLSSRLMKPLPTVVSTKVTKPSKSSAPAQTLKNCGSATSSIKGHDRSLGPLRGLSGWLVSADLASHLHLYTARSHDLYCNNAPGGRTVCAAAV